MYKTGFIGEVAEHIYFRQSFVRLSNLSRIMKYMPDCFGSARQHGIEVSNAVSNVAVKGGKIVAYGHSFVEPGQLQYLIGGIHTDLVRAVSVASPEPSLKPEDAISKAEVHLNAKYDNHPTAIEYYVTEDKHVILT